MALIRQWRFFIPPQTHIRTTRSEDWMFSPMVTDQYLLDFGLKKYNERVEKGSKNPGTPNNYYNRKKVIERYWNYKKRLKEISIEEKFVMPFTGAWIKFYIGMPESWNKKKRIEKLFTPHTSNPDIDNLVKAFFDSVLKEDKIISDYRASKVWYDGAGLVEITLGELPRWEGFTKIIREDKIK